MRKNQIAKKANFGIVSFIDPDKSESDSDDSGANDASILQNLPENWTNIMKIQFYNYI